MIGRLRSRPLAIAIVAVLQLGALSYFVWEREQRVRHGSDIVLEVIPVDPRSLFQGDYVILGYPISLIKNYYGFEPAVGQDIFVTVQKNEAGVWKYVRHTFYNERADGVPGGIVLKGRVERVLKSGGDNNDPGELRVTYGLERFFVPEGQGLNLEALVRDKKLSAIVSVWRDGSSTLKGLATEGKVLFETGVAAKRPEDVLPIEAVSAPEAVNDPTQAHPGEAVPAPDVPAAVEPAPESASPAN